MNQKDLFKERIRALKKALRDEDAGVRQKSAESLSRIEAKIDLGYYARILESNDRANKIQAIYFLAELAIEEAVELLRQQMSDVYDDVRAAVIRALGSNSSNYRAREIRRKAVEVALKGLKDDNISIRISAADALAKFGDSRSEEVLLTIITSSPDDGDEGSQLIISALLALCEIDSRRGVPIIIEKARVGSYAVKKTALEVLGVIGDSRAESCLIEALEDSNANIRMQAAESLGRLAGSAEPGFGLSH